MRRRYGKNGGSSEWEDEGGNCNTQGCRSRRGDGRGHEGSECVQPGRWERCEEDHLRSREDFEYYRSDVSIVFIFN